MKSSSQTVGGEGGGGAKAGGEGTCLIFSTQGVLPTVECNEKIQKNKKGKKITEQCACALTALSLLTVRYRWAGFNAGVLH